MNFEELARLTNLNAEVVKKHIDPFHIDIGKIDWKTLDVEARQEMRLDANALELKKQVMKLKPEKLDDIREWVGIPNRVFFRREIPGFGTVPGIRPSPTITQRLNSQDLHSISPVSKLQELESTQRTKFLAAARNLVYGNVGRNEIGTPLYQAASIHVMQRLIPAIFLLDINVGKGATLYIAPSVALITAFRIRIWKGGRIVTPKYNFVSFHCYSVQGGIV